MWHITWCCRASNERVLALGLNERRSERLPPFLKVWANLSNIGVTWSRGYVMPDHATSSLEVARVIQEALAPMFFLTAVAALLSAFSMRLGRVADHVDRLVEMLETADTGRAETLKVQLAYLRHRSRLLDTAVVLATIAAIAICCAGLALFIGLFVEGAGRGTAFAPLFYSLFAAALFSMIGALAVFLVEMLIASRGLRAKSLTRG
jgi:Protein of unknown function (DUF2721)